MTYKDGDNDRLTGFCLYSNIIGLFFIFFGTLISPWFWGMEGFLIFVLLGAAFVETSLSTHKRRTSK